MAIHPLKAVRIAKGKTLRDLSEACGIDASLLSRLERGLRPSRKQIALIAGGLEVHADDLERAIELAQQV
jgi:transcriptional regulator with XRE-family HTH domain